jgi:hypothetical protein
MCCTPPQHNSCHERPSLRVATDRNMNTIMVFIPPLLVARIFTCLCCCQPPPVPLLIQPASAFGPACFLWLCNSSQHTSVPAGRQNITVPNVQHFHNSTARCHQRTSNQAAADPFLHFVATEDGHLSLATAWSTGAALTSVCCSSRSAKAYAQLAQLSPSSCTPLLAELQISSSCLHTSTPCNLQVRPFQKRTYYAVVLQAC